jgi:hypothetical protein
MTEIDIGKILGTEKPFKVEINQVVTGRTFIASITRFGKSWCARKIAEEVFGHCGLIIVDVEGEYVSLREKYPFLIIGKDIPLQLETAEFMAEKILEANISVIIDLSLTEVELGKEYVNKLLRRFFFLETTMRKPYLIIVEEAEEFCLSEDTEVLTIDGWKTYQEISEGELVLTLNIKTKRLEYQPIKRLIIRPYRGELISIKTKTIDALLTPEHRVLLQTYNHGKYGPWRWNDEYEFRSADSLLRSGFRIPACGIYDSEDVPIPDDVIRLVGWIITEGRLHKTHKGRNFHLEIEQSVRHHDNILEIRKILERLGIKYSEYYRKRRNKIEGETVNTQTVTFHLDRNDCKQIFELLGNSIHEIPRTLLNASRRQLWILYDTLVKGDGTRKHHLTRISKGPRERNDKFFAGNNQKLADQFQELCIKLGIRAIVSGSPKDRRVCISERFPYHYIKKSALSQQYYNGVTWDITVDNGTFVARRNGKPFITGNCPEKGIATTTCLEILRNITKKGGKRGIGIVVIAHRPAWVSKGVLSQCVNKAIGRIDWPSDLNVLEEFARIPKAAIEKLPTLGKGEFCFTGDWVKELTFVKVGQVKTTHLGFTPQVIPPSPKELKTVIESLQKALPEVIEKIKPTVVSTAELESKIRSELEAKYKSKIEAILKTADEKAERKYKVRIEQLQEQLDKLSRAQALQPVAHITDPLEHPIVKARMLELPDKARDLLIKIEREPGLTREQLAAFLTTSKDTVAGLVDKINRVFRATVIIGDGKPIRYKSMLKRLFITDVAKREIEEIERLQADNRAKAERIQKLEEENKLLHSTIQQIRVNHDELERLRQTVTSLKETNTKLESALQTARADMERLKKEAELVQRLRELLSIERVDEKKIEAIIEQKLGAITPVKAEASIDEAKIESLIEQKISQKMVGPHGFIPTSIELEHKVTRFDFHKPEEHVKVDTTTLQGRIIYLITKGFFNTRHNRKEVVTELSNHGWVHNDKEVDDALTELCQKGIFYRKISTGNVYWYTLQPEAKELIHGG